MQTNLVRKQIHDLLNAIYVCFCPKIYVLDSNMHLREAI